MLKRLINGELTVICHSKAEFDTLDSILRSYADREVKVTGEVSEEEAKDYPFYYIKDGIANYDDCANGLPRPIIQFSEFTIFDSSEEINVANVQLEDLL